jgi:hypothetical protein
MSELPKNVEKILINYSLLQPYQKDGPEWNILSQHGLAFNKEEVEHDQICDWFLNEKEKALKESIVAAFYSGLALCLPQMRCALPAYAFSLHFDLHQFSDYGIKLGSKEESGYCATCMKLKNFRIDKTFFHSCRWTGSLIGGGQIDKAYLYLEAHRMKIGYPEQLTDDVITQGKLIFKDILNLVEESSSDETPKKLANRLKKYKILKFNEQLSRSFVELLGYAGILQPVGHPSYLDKFITGIPPRKTHSSDWAYPVDFWTGKDGINKNALVFWFGTDFQ